MPNRILREGILTSPKMMKLGWADEVFYRRLMSVVDDFGRYYADHGMLRAACYPRQLSKVSDSDIGKWLTALVEAALVRVYPAEDGERYLELIKFGQHVRAKKSKFPHPRSTCTANAVQPQADAHLDVFVDEDDLCTEQRSCTDAEASPCVVSLPLVDGGEYPITQNQVDDWTPAYPGIDIVIQLQRARVWLEANPKKRKTRSGIVRFVTSWLGRAQDSGRSYASTANEPGVGRFV